MTMTVHGYTMMIRLDDERKECVVFELVREMSCVGEVCVCPCAVVCVCDSDRETQRERDYFRTLSLSLSTTIDS